MRVVGEANKYLSDHRALEAEGRPTARADGDGAARRGAGASATARTLLAPFLPFSAQAVHEVLGGTGDVSPMPEIVRSTTSTAARPRPTPSSSATTRPRRGWGVGAGRARHAGREAHAALPKLDPAVADDRGWPGWRDRGRSASSAPTRASGRRLPEPLPVVAAAWSTTTATSTSRGATTPPSGALLLGGRSAAGVPRAVQVGYDVDGRPLVRRRRGRFPELLGRRGAPPERGAPAGRRGCPRRRPGGDRAAGRAPAGPGGRRDRAGHVPHRPRGPPRRAPRRSRSAGTSTWPSGLDLPLQIHDRDAHDDVLRILAEEGAPERTVLHCFSGDAEMAREFCASRGYVLSIAGTLTFNNAGPLREALRAVPLEQLQVETDAPYLTPAPYRGRPNAGYLVPITVRAMAEVLERPLEEVCGVLASTSEGSTAPGDGRAGPGADAPSAPVRFRPRSRFGYGGPVGRGRGSLGQRHPTLRRTASDTLVGVHGAARSTPRPSSREPFGDARGRRPAVARDRCPESSTSGTLCSLSRPDAPPGIAGQAAVLSVLVGGTAAYAANDSHRAAHRRRQDHRRSARSAAPPSTRSSPRPTSRWARTTWSARPSTPRSVTAASSSSSTRASSSSWSTARSRPTGPPR